LFIIPTKQLPSSVSRFNTNYTFHTYKTRSKDDLRSQSFGTSLKHRLFT